MNRCWISSIEGRDHTPGEFSAKTQPINGNPEPNLHTNYDLYDGFQLPVDPSDSGRATRKGLWCNAITTGALHGPTVQQSPFWMNSIYSARGCAMGSETVHRIKGSYEDREDQEKREEILNFYSLEYVITRKMIAMDLYRETNATTSTTRTTLTYLNLILIEFYFLTGRSI